MLRLHVASLTQSRWASTAMIVIPVLDVHDGPCLPKGGTSPSAALVRSDPNDALRALVRFGFSRFHIAAPNSRASRRGAFNLTATFPFLHSAQFQVSNNVRQRDQIDDLLGAGASFVVVGPAGVDDEDWLSELVIDDARTVIIAFDVYARRLYVPDTQVGVPRKAADWIEELSRLTPSSVLIRSVDARGHAAPCDFAMLEDLVENVSCPVLAAGVLETVGELEALQDRGVAGALLGECLQFGRINPWTAAQDFCA